MTDSKNTQPVAQQPETEAQPSAEGQGAQTADMDSLLNEFDTATRTATPEPQPRTVANSKPSVEDLAARLAAFERDKADSDFQKAFEPVLRNVRGEIPEQVISNAELTDLIDGKAKRDPRLQQAWLNRAQNPQAWSKIEKALQAEFAQKFRASIDEGVTADREAVAAHLRGASTNKAPPEAPVKFGSVSDADLEKEWSKVR